jgi:ABC-type Fe3+ transport system permease subunit
MPSLRSSLLVTIVAVGCAFVILAGFEVVSLPALALAITLMIAAVTVGLAITSAGHPQRTVASMLSDEKAK